MTPLDDIDPAILERLRSIEAPSPVYLVDPERIPWSKLGIQPVDEADIREGWPDPCRDADVWWLLERCHHELITDMGGTMPLEPWPKIPGDDATARYFVLYVLLASLPHTLRWNRSRAIPESIVWDTLDAVGQSIADERQRTGAGSLRSNFWFPLHFRGGIHRLGRLQYNRWLALRTDAELKAAHAPMRSGAAVLGMHIRRGTPLTPQACDDSLASARSFFCRHFPDETYRVATCGSWLLDPALQELLPATSNIVRFQRRFNLLPGGHPGDDEVRKHVFDGSSAGIDDLPAETALQQGVIAHWRRGETLEVREGWILL